MTPEQLAEIRARAEAATPGPWGAVKWSALWEVRTPAVEPGVAFELDHVDAEFVAHARKDIPALLDYIEELQEALRGIEDCVAHPDSVKEVAGTICVKCLAQVAALQIKEGTNE